MTAKEGVALVTALQAMRDAITLMEEAQQRKDPEQLLRSRKTLLDLQAQALASL
jgi:hypothetical protein